MNSIIYSFIIIFIIILLFKLIIYFCFTENFKVIRLDNTKYKVYEEYINNNDAANILNEMRTKIEILIDHLNKKYILNSENLLVKDKMNINKYNYLKSGTKRLINNFKPNNIRENIPKNKNDDTSFVINKGDVFGVCIRNLSLNKNYFHNLNDITFVCIHEVSHLMNRTFGHDETFWLYFKLILEESINLGIYKFHDYGKNPVDYCKIQITYTPLTDISLSDKNVF